MQTRRRFQAALTGLCLLMAAPGAWAQAGHKATDVVLGAAAAPPAGPGPGRLFAVAPAPGRVRAVAFAKAGTPAGNSFYVGYDPAARRIYVPSVAGRMTVFDAGSLRPVGHFPVLRGARLARVVPRAHLVLVLSGQYLAGYSLGSHRALFTLPVGGNAIAVDAARDRAFIGGNMDHVITEVALPSGKVTARYPVAGSGDLVFAQGKLFSADIRTGVLTVLDPGSRRVIAVRTPEVDPHFSYRRIPAATAGFMQLALSPAGHTLYAAGFSGHILKFSTGTGAYLGELPVRAGKGANKLSGLAIVDGGRQALVTVENRHETVLISLASGAVLHRFPGVNTNRWVPAAGR